MGKCRPLNAAEAEAMTRSTHHLRDRALLIGLKRTGYQVSEIGSLLIEDVYDFASKTVKPRV